MCISNFSIRNKAKGTLISWCKPCVKEYDKERLKKYQPIKQEKRRIRRQKIREKICDLKSKPCTDCNKSYPYYVMQYDHCKADKEHNITDMVKNGLGFDTIKKEIDKCELVCANCHAERTHSRSNGKYNINHNIKD